MRRSPRLLSATPSTVASDKGDTKEAKEGADQTKKAPAGTAGRDLAEKPRDFDEVWALITELRAIRDAPVDTMGCHMLTDPEATEEDRCFQLLIAVMLSSQTKDQENAKAMHNLHSHFKGNGGLTRANLAGMDEKDLDAQIRGVGFHNTKTRNLIKVANILKEQFNGKVPDIMEDLLSLPGVGPKMAVLVMEIGHGHRDAGICVDTHVHRIAAMLGWTKNAKTPEATRQQLEARLPLKVWPDVNLLLVGLGQMVQQRPFELLRRCIDCIHPLAALKLVGRIGCNLKVVDKLTGDTIVDVAEAAHCGQDVMDYLKTRGVEEGHRSPARITPSRRKRKGDAGTAEEARRGSAKCRAGLDGFTYSGH